MVIEIVESFGCMGLFFVLLRSRAFVSIWLRGVKGLRQWAGNGLVVGIYGTGLLERLCVCHSLMIRYPPCYRFSSCILVYMNSQAFILSRVLTNV